MKLISRVEIRGFRSIRAGVLTDLGDFNAFAGLNNSGKSNLLRSLNAFFNGVTDAGQLINVDRDYYRPDLRKKKAKRISIAVTFALPDEFKFRKGLESVEALLGGRSFTITKEWRRNEPLPLYHLNGGPALDAADRQRIDQFLQLISFRYIPNRVLPLDVIRSEHQALRDVLIRRLGKRAKDATKAFRAIRTTSDSLIAALSKRLRDAAPNMGEVRLATPTSWGDMVFAFGYRLLQGGVELDDVAQGSGVQSLLMFETLYLIDRDYFQKFGWRQAAIWAVEEPESSLHSSLEARVSSYLASISRDASSRLQIVATTHSDLMLQYSGKAVMVEHRGGETFFESTSGARDVLERMSKAGVSRWAHPVLHFPLDPLVLVEGKYDHAFFEEAVRCLRPARPVRVTYLGQLGESGQTGGVEEMLRYVRDNASAIKSRSMDAPVVVVLDWDAANKQPSFQRLFQTEDAFKVVAWPSSALNPKLGPTFRGIERSYSDRLIVEAETRGVPIARKKDGVGVIDKADYGKAKEVLYELVRAGLQDEDLLFAKTFLEEVFAIAVGANPQTP